VAFGSTTKPEPVKPIDEGLKQFSTDVYSIEKKSTKTIINNYYTPGFFGSKE